MNPATLAEILKKHGLEVAEDQAVTLVRSVFKALPEIAQETPNKIDDLIVPFLMSAQPKLLEILDKIDGQVG